MALLQSCYCCNLLIASVLVGVYVMVAYVIAFTIELWWILETEVTLPAPAYLLCVGYFFVFLQSALLLHGLSVKRTFFLMGWIFVLVIFSFPEGGLVLFMSLYHWKLDHLYGLTELTCWVCRLCINIAGLLIVQSLYSQWKEEEEVIHRINALSMASMVPQRVPVSPGNGTNSLIGYQNEGFVKSTNQINGTLRRSHNPAANGYAPQQQFIPLNNNIYPSTPPQQLNNIPQYYPPIPDFGCEFNASQFNASNQFTNQIYNNLEIQSNNLGFKRTRSLIDFRNVKKTKDDSDVISVKSYVPPGYTQSLDRRAVRFAKKSNSANDVNGVNDFGSLQRMNVYRDPQGRFVLQSMEDRGMIADGRMRQAGSGRSLAESDDFRKYSDFAL